MLYWHEIKLNRGYRTFSDRNSYEGTIGMASVRSSYDAPKYYGKVITSIPYFYDGYMRLHSLYENGHFSWRFSNLYRDGNFYPYHGRVKFMNPLGIPLSYLQDDRFPDLLMAQAIERTYEADAHLQDVLIESIKKFEKLPYSNDDLYNIFAKKIEERS